MNLERYSDKITELFNEFERRFENFRDLEEEMNIFKNPFSVDIEKVPYKLQLELVEIQGNTLLKEKYKMCTVEEFYKYLDDSYPVLRELASKFFWEAHIYVSNFFQQ
jgi:hypothetical protein